MSSNIVVLDNNVLSAFVTSDWFENLAFWDGKYEVVVSGLVWTEEFRPNHDWTTPPPWLTVRDADLSRVEATAIGQLSRQDWSCLALFHSHDGFLVTNDRRLHETACDRDVDVEWGTKFVQRTYVECGITTQEFESGVEQYITDTYLSTEIADWLRNSEK